MEIDYNKIKRMMEENNITQTEMMRNTGISNTNLSNKLNGKRKFTVVELKRISDVFNVKMEFFLK